MSLFSGLLLRSRVGCARCCFYLLVVVVRGVFGVGVVGGSGLRASNRSAGHFFAGVFRDRWWRVMVG